VPTLRGVVDVPGSTMKARSSGDEVCEPPEPTVVQTRGICSRLRCLRTLYRCAGHYRNQRGIRAWTGHSSPSCLQTMERYAPGTMTQEGSQSSLSCRSIETKQSPKAVIEVQQQRLQGDASLLANLHCRAPWRYGRVAPPKRTLLPSFLPARQRHRSGSMDRSYWQ
jgi:hypothetical protein